MLGVVFPEVFNRTIRNLLGNFEFLNGNANWLSELPSVTKQYKKTIHHSTKTTPTDGSEKINEKTVFSNLRDSRKNIILDMNQDS